MVRHKFSYKYYDLKMSSFMILSLFLCDADTYRYGKDKRIDLRPRPSFPAGASITFSNSTGVEEEEEVEVEVIAK